MNHSLDYKDLLKDIQTNLYMGIVNEFNIDSDPSKIRAWIYSIINWRTLDRIRKECDLSYKPLEKKYKALDKITLEKAFEDVDRSHDNDGLNQNSHTKSEEPQHKNLNLDYFIRKSKIDFTSKVLLLLVFVYGYSYDESSEILCESKNKIKERLLPKAIEDFVESLSKTNLFTREELYKILNDKQES